jgi:hypothetical protein
MFERMCWIVVICVVACMLGSCGCWSHGMEIVCGLSEIVGGVIEYWAGGVCCWCFSAIWYWVLGICCGVGWLMSRPTIVVDHDDIVGSTFCALRRRIVLVWYGFSRWFV